MGQGGRYLIGLAAAGLCLTLIVAAGVWWLGYGQALDQVARRGEADLALASDRLTAQLQRYQEVAVLSAEHPALAGLPEGAPREAADALLLEIADKTSALALFYVGATGKVLAASHPGAERDVSGAAYFRRAMTGALGAEPGIEPRTGGRAYFYAAPSFGPEGKVRGALVVAADMENVESEWRGARPAVYFVDAGGEVFVSNRSELVFWTRAAGRAGLGPPTGTVPMTERIVNGHEIWHQDYSAYVPQRALHLVRDLPVIGLTGEALIDVNPARRIAFLQAAAVAGLMLFFVSLLSVAMVRRRTLSEANAVLEDRVTARTQALLAANSALRHEVGERQEAEAKLTQAQAELVQASKLSALGQMSAGISHELNQPLMAIRSFAENGAAFIERGHPDKAAQNLGRISDLARRMGRIIKNLRAFARQETEPFGVIDLGAAIATALEMTEDRRRRDGVALVYAPPAAPIWVEAGDVRLAQVLVNLITNACDAMQGAQGAQLEIGVAEQDGRASVTVADTGPGLGDPEKIFDPFYSTKEVGASEGMGLGLSISYGIVQSFGGAIRGRNRSGPQGGAEFTVDLVAAAAEDAA